MNNKGHKNISPAQAWEWLLSGEAVLIDVREPEEFQSGHIPYAMSIPLAELGDAFQYLELPPTRKVIFQCLRGGRGEKACALMNAHMDDCDVYNISGGIEAWHEAKLPMAGQSNQSFTPKISIFRQVQIIVGSMVTFLVAIGFMGLTLAFALVGILGSALVFAGMTGWCGLAMLLNKAPWNKR